MESCRSRTLRSRAQTLSTCSLGATPVEALVAGDWVKLGPGSVIFQASNIDHAIRNAGEVPATYHVIKWNSPGMLAKRDAAKAAAKAKAMMKAGKGGSMIGGQVKTRSAHNETKQETRTT